MKRKSTIELWDELERLARKNGRYVSTLKDGTIVTADFYEGCDAHYSDTVEEAIEWERRYL